MPSIDGWLLLLRKTSVQFAPHIPNVSWNTRESLIKSLGVTLLRPVEEVRHHLFGELKADVKRRVSGL